MTFESVGMVNLNLAERMVLQIACIIILRA